MNLFKKTCRQFFTLSLFLLLSAPVVSHAASDEAIYWQTVSQTNDAAMYQAYLNKYPQGEFADLAKISLNNLGYYHFQVGVTPATTMAAIRILNIKPTYTWNTWLQPGKYQVEVSAPEYVTQTRWVVLERDNQTFTVDLQRNRSIKPDRSHVEGYDKAPPAVQMSYELGTKTWDAYQALLKNKPLQAAKILDLRMEDKNNLPLNRRITPDTPSYDFGYHVVAAMVWSQLQKSKNPNEVNLGETIEGLHNLKIKQIPNENMRLAAQAYVQYVNHWELEKRQDLKEIERSLFSSILLSLGRPLSEADTYLAESTTPEERTQYVTTVLIPVIEKMKEGLDLRFPPEVERDVEGEWFRVKLVEEISSYLRRLYAQEILTSHSDKTDSGIKKIAEKKYVAEDIFFSTK
jgi:hypothetical protein